jgi:predicted phage terminase large subunit-like protein
MRGRWGFVESARQISAMAARHPEALTIVEDKANGPAVLEHLRGVVPALYPVSPDGSKVVRAHAVSALIEAGRAFLPEMQAARYVGAFLDETSSFPEGADDDRVDATSQALRFLARQPSFARRRRAG